MTNEMTGTKHEPLIDIKDASGIEKIKDLLKENYKWTFKTNDKRNPFFNDVEISKGELIYRRILIGKEDVNFETKLLTEFLDILNQRSMMLSEFEALNNKNFQKTWSLNNKKVLRATKKGYLFEVAFSVHYI